MSKAKEILEERFARGEINENEFSKLLETIERGGNAVEAEDDKSGKSNFYRVNNPVPVFAEEKNFSWWHVVAGVVGLIVLMSIFGANSRGLNIGSIVRNGNNTSLKISNSSKKSGDILIWVEQNGIETCEHVFHAEPSKVYSLTISCPNLGVGKYNVWTKWAKSNGKASVAKRIKIN